MVVVTGASGHIGAVLVRDLLARSRAVRVMLREGDTAPSLAGLDVEIARGDVRDPATLRAAFRGADVVFHLAGIISIQGDPDGNVRAVNVEGARAAAEASLACGVRRHVHVSSVHAFDHAPLHAPLTEASGRPGPAHPAYDRSKAAGEAAVREVFARGLDGVVVYPTGILGPLDFAPSHAGNALLRYARGQVPVVPDGGFDWVDVRDVSAGLLAAAERGRSGEGYLLSGKYWSARALGEIVEEVVGVPAPRVVAPLPALGLVAPVLELTAKILGGRPLFTRDMLHALRCNPDIRSDKAKAELGHAPRPFRDTVADTLAWFAERGMYAPSARLGVA